MQNLKLENLKRLVITCGGTGGHFYPGLSIARTFKEQGGSVLLFLAGKNSVSQAETAKKYGIDSVIMDAAPRPSNPVQILKFFKSLFSGFMSARRELKKFKPDAFLGMGSFASTPSALAAKSCGVPLFLHDGNARIGKANRILSRFAKAVFMGFPAVNKGAVKAPLVLTGMPARPELLGKALSKADALASIDSAFSADKMTLLVFGGSQGAEVFNKVLPEALCSINKDNLQVLHLSGPGKLESVKEAYSKASFKVYAAEKTDDMRPFYSAADIIICRSGGSSVSEILNFGKASILIPYPYAAELHQDDNAEYLRSNGAAVMVKNSEFTKEKASSLILDFLANPDSFKEAGKQALQLAMPDASYRILSEMNVLIGE